jgi:MSHA biogenesis protein MshI
VLVTMELPDVGATTGPAPSSLQDEDTRSLYVVVAQETVVQSVAQAFKDAGQRLDAIDVRETAQRNIAAQLEEGEECLCLLRITQEGVQLTFTHRGELYLDRFIGQPMTVLQGSDDFERQRLIERICQQTQLSINHIQTHHAGISVKRVVLCPLPVPLDLLDPLRQQIGLPVETLNLEQIFDFSAVPALQSAAGQARYFVALGATLRGLGKHT